VDRNGLESKLKSQIDQLKISGITNMFSTLTINNLYYKLQMLIFTAFTHLL